MMDCNYVRDIDPGIIYKIQLLLAVDGNWNKLLTVSSIDREQFNNYAKKLEYKEEIIFARTVLDFCEDFLITDFILWLEQISLEEALLMLKKDEPLEIIEEPEELIKVDIGQQEEFILSCKAKGFPTPKYQWYHNYVPLSKDSVLKIPAELKNSGHYSCEVYNINRSGIKTFLRTSGVNVLISNNALDALCHRENENEDCFTSDKFDSSISGKNNDEMNCENETHFAIDKFALLIGINQYDWFNNLSQATKDVSILSTLLQSIDFKTFSFQNLTRNEILEAVNLFCTFLRPGTYSVVYFAGHGFEWYKRYLLPKDAKSCRPEESINIEFILKCLQERHVAMNLVLLDICCSLSDECLNEKLHPGRTFIPDPSWNTIIGCATSSTYSSYEDENSSIYVHYLEKHIKKSIPVWEMLLKVHQDIKMNPTMNYRQYPTIFCDLTSPLKLTDKINGQGELFEMESRRWKLFTGEPDNLTFKRCNFNLILKFINYQEFCNALEAYLFLQVLCNQELSTNDYEGLLEFPKLETEISQKNDVIKEDIKLICTAVIFNTQHQLFLEGKVKVTQKLGNDCLEENICIPLPLARYMRKHLRKNH